MHPPAVVSVTGVAKDGWIDFVNFGGAAQPNKVPEDRMPDDQFQINFGERLKAYFHVELDDLRVQQALHDRVDLPPDPHIGGTLDGDFDFDLERGRSGQTFP